MITLSEFSLPHDQVNCTNTVYADEEVFIKGTQSLNNRSFNNYRSKAGVTVERAFPESNVPALSTAAACQC